MLCKDNLGIVITSVRSKEKIIYTFLIFQKNPLIARLQFNA